MNNNYYSFIDFSVLVDCTELFDEDFISRNVKKQTRALLSSYGVIPTFKKPPEGMGGGGGYETLFELLKEGRVLLAMLGPIKWMVRKFKNRLKKITYLHRPSILISLTINHPARYREDEYIGVGRAMCDFYLLGEHLVREIKRTYSTFKVEALIDINFTKPCFQVITALIDIRLSEYKVNMLIKHLGELEDLSIDKIRGKAYSYNWTRFGLLCKSISKAERRQGIWISFIEDSKKYYYFH